MRVTLVAIVLSAFAAVSTAAHACGKDLQLMQTVSQGGEPPLLRCGREFNEMLAHVSKHEWQAALASYRTHLGSFGKWMADSDDAKAALAWLEKQAQTK